MLIWVSQQNIVTYNINFAVIVANTILGYVISSKRDIVCPKHSHKMPIHYDIYIGLLLFGTQSLL